MVDAGIEEAGRLGRQGLGLVGQSPGDQAAVEATGRRGHRELARDLRGQRPGQAEDESGVEEARRDPDPHRAAEVRPSGSVQGGVGRLLWPVVGSALWHRGLSSGR